MGTRPDFGVGVPVAVMLREQNERIDGLQNALAAMRQRAEAAEAKLAAVPAYAAYVAEEDKVDGPYGPGGYMRFDEWLDLQQIT